MSTKPLIVNCPQCAGPSVFAASNRFRPFCSERCKQIDLGAWASDAYVVSGSKGTETDPSSDQGVSGERQE